MDGPYFTVGIFTQSDSECLKDNLRRSATLEHRPTAEMYAEICRRSLFHEKIRLAWYT
jgi:hypothetical protein